MLFHVVEFSTTKDLAVVPEIWLKEERTICYWPPYKCDSKLTRAISQAEEPADSWEVHKVRCVSRTGDTYEIARIKCKKAEVTSDLTSECTDGENKRPKRKRKRIEFPEDSDESENDPFERKPSQKSFKIRCVQKCPPAAGNFPQKESNGKHMSSGVAKDVQVTSRLQSFSSNSNDETDSFSSPSSVTELQNALVYSRFRPSQAHVVLHDRPLIKNAMVQEKTQNLHGHLSEVQASHSMFLSQIEGETENVSAYSKFRPSQVRAVLHDRPLTKNAVVREKTQTLPGHVSHVQSSNSVFLSQIEGETENVSAVSSYEKYLLRTLESLKKQVELNTYLLQQSLASSNNVPSSEAEEFTKLFPLKSEDDVQFIESFIEENTKKNLIEFLGRIGGISVQNTVRRILSHVLSREVAINYSWAGLRGKRAFKSLKLKDVVFDAVRQNSKTRTATDCSIEAVVKAWLRCSSDRDGGRSSRSKKNSSECLNLNLQVNN